MTLCIRLFSELILGRYEVPLPDPSESLLARHATSLLEENIHLYTSLGCDHRSEAFNSLILPECQKVIEAMGHAHAYSAGLRKNLPKTVLDIYESSVMRQDPAWYSEKAGITRMDQRLREDAAVTSALPHLASLLADLNIDDYVSAPIVSDGRWKTYLSGLPVYSGNALPTNPARFQAVL